MSLKTSARSTVQTTLSFKYRLFQNDMILIDNKIVGYINDSCI